VWVTILYIALLLLVLYWLRRRGDELPRPPSGIISFSSEVDDMDLILHWTNSTPSPARQAPLKHTLIEERLSAELPWSVVNVVPAGTTLLRVPDIERGRHFYRATEIDLTDRPSNSRPELTVDIPFDALDGVVDFTFEVVP
jgi:hypothetical protein